MAWSTLIVFRALASRKEGSSSTSSSTHLMKPELQVQPQEPTMEGGVSTGISTEKGESGKSLEAWAKRVEDIIAEREKTGDLFF